MKNNKLITAILFGAAAIVQMFTTVFIFASAMAQLPAYVYFEIVVLVGLILACLYSLKSAETEYTCAQKKQGVALLVFYAIFMAMNYNFVLGIIVSSFSVLYAPWAQIVTPSVIVLIVRSLLILGAVALMLVPNKKSSSLEENVIVDKELNEVEAIDSTEATPSEAE